MPRKCTICQHPRRAEIDRRLVAGSPLRDVAVRFGLSKSAVFRHKRKDLPTKLLKAADALERIEANGLMDHVLALRDKTLGILAQAEGNGDLRMALHAIREARATLELMGKVSGELPAPPEREQRWQPSFVLPEGTRVSIFPAAPSEPAPSPTAKEEPPLLPAPKK